MSGSVDLRLLRYVLAVAESGSLVAAASVLHVGQPAISRQITQVERALGFDLFERTPRGMTLSAAGRTYIEHARALVHQADSLDVLANEIACGEPAALRISAPYVTITEILAPFVAEQHEVDAARLTFVPAPGDSPYRLVGSEADIAITSATVADGLEWSVLGRIPLYAQMSADHVLAGQPEVSVADLSTERTLLQESGHQIRFVTDQAFAIDACEYTDHMEFTVPRIAQALAARGQGIAILATPPVFGLRAVPIVTSVGPVHVPIHAAWRRDHFARERILEVVELISRYYRAWIGGVSPQTGG